MEDKFFGPSEKTWTFKANSNGLSIFRAGPSIAEAEGVLVTPDFGGLEKRSERDNLKHTVSSVQNQNPSEGSALCRVFKVES